jgi:hypothetical protein
MRSFTIALVLGLVVWPACGSNAHLMPLLPPATGEPLWAPAGAQSDEPPSLSRYSSILRFTIPDADLDKVADELKAHFSIPEWRPRVSEQMAARWQSWRGGGVSPSDAQGRLIFGEHLYWHGAWQDARDYTITYRLSTTRPFGEARSTLYGYVEYAAYPFSSGPLDCWTIVVPLVCRW